MWTAKTLTIYRPVQNVWLEVGINIHIFLNYYFSDSTRESCGDSAVSDGDNFDMINPPSMAATSDAANSGDTTKPTPTESALIQQPFNPKKRLMQWVVSQSSSDNNGANTKNESDDMGVKPAAGVHEQTNGDNAGRSLVLDNDFTNAHRLAQFFQPFTTLHVSEGPEHMLTPIQST
jgi:hypothetical protein